MVLCQKTVDCSLRVWSELLPSSKEVQVSQGLISEGKMDREMDRRIGAAAAVMWGSYRTVLVKKEQLRLSAMLSIYQSIYIATLTYGHERWVVKNERIRSQIQKGRKEFPLKSGWAHP